MFKRPSNRAADQLRPIFFTRNYTCHAQGSVLFECGKTKIICTASIEEKVPSFLRGKGQGWITAEYSMLPSATHERSQREALRGKQGGRTLEIQRMIGRSMRAACDLQALGERTIYLDCDVIQADGGTRTAAVTGAYVALKDAIMALIKTNVLEKNPLFGQIAATSVGIYQGLPILDLDYAEDSMAETDMNVVMNEAGQFIEIQGTAEGHAFRRDELNKLLDLAASGISSLMELQNAALNKND